MEMPELSDKELDRYSRNIALEFMGYEGQKKLRKSKVCIVGLGGLGCSVAVQLARLGIGFLRLVDMDIVEVSNLHRQVLYDMNDIGYPKVDAAKKRILEINPDIEVEVFSDFLDASNVDEVVKGVDVVVDGLDSLATRYTLNAACIKFGIPFVFASAIESYGNVYTMIPGETACLECFYGGVEEEDLPGCAQVGVFLPSLMAITGIETSEAVRVILEKPLLLKGRLLYVDFTDMSFREIDIVRNESCPVCSVSPEEIAFKVRKDVKVLETCSRDMKNVFVIIPAKNKSGDFQRLKEKIGSSFKIIVDSQSGITFHYNEDTQVSLLSSGIGVIKTSMMKEGSLELFRKFVG
ncbi:MAG: ThiF family adenylyltransferase [Candidatus Hodarchaeota archaeon]